MEMLDYSFDIFVEDGEQDNPKITTLHIASCTLKGVPAVLVRKGIDPNDGSGLEDLIEGLLNTERRGIELLKEWRKDPITK